ncbi:MAG: hypothetical protein RRY40_03640 [Oscillospiraceae bacterium]
MSSAQGSQNSQNNQNNQSNQSNQSTQNNQNSQKSQSNQNCQNNLGYQSNILANPHDILLAALTISLALSAGRSRYEVETLINLCSLVTDNLQSALAQMIINDKAANLLEVKI